MASAPKPPDPYETAAAQSAMNRETAITQQQLNMVDQITPWGSVTYSRGSWDDPAASGGSRSGTPVGGSSSGSGVSAYDAVARAFIPGYDGTLRAGAGTSGGSGGSYGAGAADAAAGGYTPKFTQTTTLSPSQQAIFDKSQEAQGNLAGIAADQSAFLADYLGKKIDLSGLPALKSSFGSGYNTNFDPKLAGLGPDYSTSLGDGYVTSYAGADDFSADRRRYEDALWERTAGDRSAADADLRTTLANKGIKEGSPAWNAEMERMASQNTDARLATLLAGGQEQSRMVGLARDAATFGNDAILGRFGAENAASLAKGQFLNNNEAMRMQAQSMSNDALAREAGFNNSARGQGFSEAFAERNQPINEITALLSGAQVSNPAQMGAATPQTGVAGVDYAGLVNNNYNQRLNANNAMMGGLFGLGSAAIGLF